MDIKARLQDPRYYQIAVLSSLVLYGVIALDFGVRFENAVVIVAMALAVQLAGTRAAGLPRFDPLSPLITSLSLTLLLRTDLVVIAATAAAIAMGSKFLVRVRGKHVFNPANVAIVTLMVFSDHAWISSGQWGSAALGAFALACLGCVVLTRAKRAETTIAFVCAYALLLFGRALWLGDPLTIPLHQLQNGALLLFAFFMISDPKTTPDAPVGRIIYATFVASVAFTIQFVFYQPHGPIIALVLTAPVVPIIDHVFHGKIYRWDRPSADPLQQIKGVKDANSDNGHRRLDDHNAEQHGSGLLRLLRRESRHEPL
ncbi:MAG: RnfABCDGE type electron transport complex subunit D [Woeseiaceae bacterium]